MIALATAVALAVATAAGADDSGKVAATTVAGETTFELSRDGCSGRLIRRSDNPTLIYQPDCHQDIEARTDVFTRLVGAALATQGDREAGATVLVPSMEKAFPDFARRLAHAASRSTEWYGERAKRDPRFGNPLVVKIATTPPVYRELQEALRQQGLNIRLAAVDNLKIALPAQTPFADWLADRAVNPRDQVPYDADVSFRISQ